MEMNNYFECTFYLIWRIIMKKIILLGFIMTTLSSCITNRVNLLKTNEIVLNEVVPPELKVSTSVYNDDGNLVILGRLSRGSLDIRRIPGHVDVDIVSPTKEELANIKASFRSLPTWRHGPSPVAFRVELPGSPPIGSTINVIYHREQH